MRFLLFRLLFCFFFSLLLTLYIIPILIKIANRFSILDSPDGRVKKHKKPVPYLGGFGLYIPFIATLALFYPFENKILWLLLGVTLLLFVGFIDDLKVLAPSQKFLGQFIAVACFLKGGFSLKTVFFSNSLNIAISTFWMLSVINAFNLIDVMDGLTAVIAFFAGLSFLVISFLFNQYNLAILLLSFMGPVIGFYFYNKSPAKIYLGDAGALFVGGFFAAIPQLFSWGKQHAFAYYAAIIILGIPLLELFFLVVIRTFKGIPFYNASPHHFSIFLRKKGWYINKILLFISIMSLILFTVSYLFVFNYIGFGEVFFSGIVFLIFWIYIIFN